jgi:hypothetical protein
MHKLIQTIALGAVVLSPISIIGLATAAEAHHTGSHVSTVSIATTQTKPKTKKGKKPTTGTMKKPGAGATTTSPMGTPGMDPSTKVKPATPDATIPSTKINPNGAGVDGSTKPNTIKVPTSDTTAPTGTPGSVANPAGSMSNPTTPNVPTGLPK